MLVLECVHGPDLHQYVVRHSSDAEVCNRFRLLMDVACALRYLHAQQPQIVHGDLKGSNVADLDGTGGGDADGLANPRLPRCLVLSSLACC